MGKALHAEGTVKVPEARKRDHLGPCSCCQWGAPIAAGVGKGYQVTKLLSLLLPCH